MRGDMSSDDRLWSAGTLVAEAITGTHFTWKHAAEPVQNRPGDPRLSTLSSPAPLWSPTCLNCRGRKCDMDTLLIVLLVVLLLGGGGWGYSRWRA
jgi:hypothetical protein